MAEEWGDWPIDDENTQLMDLHPFWDQEPRVIPREWHVTTSALAAAARAAA
ncbi:LOW QUALITY PROTEIN: hypothetical protein SPRG_16043 [Saprolegnia parasitica CBS 223.65]|uniref:Uncharacterized protein n=1 Tax=Saprolegnia parasitica (strain CBS 223.65) TaxID=695850 RepID=A0A067BJG2_SAPPC|nr:LOW QUALITY PROTEIN: hypothetical protein SPRG_16043 [Saprolegnia parasitica CBS 223.65]KDO18574.1 LOW QUALITY PROTEIN: hypothetical protein SPRG_16043 [Saprolegnia parasitica CBS 223.65]|eukprot:XP_012210725.1 LOW QUALITY PROTEIN: hypothetical protein SPRG_16043 [Saprolegnia parasitica CBS 223.65]